MPDVRQRRRPVSPPDFLPEPHDKTSVHPLRLRSLSLSMCVSARELVIFLSLSDVRRHLPLPSRLEVSDHQQLALVYLLRQPTPWLRLPSSADTCASHEADSSSDTAAAAAATNREGEGERTGRLSTRATLSLSLTHTLPARKARISLSQLSRGGGSA